MTTKKSSLTVLIFMICLVIGLVSYAYSVNKQLHSLQTQLKNERAQSRKLNKVITKLELSRESLSVQIFEEMDEREVLWEEGVRDAFLTRSMPAEISRAMIDTWNNTKIAHKTGFKLEPGAPQRVTK